MKFQKSAFALALTVLLASGAPAPAQDTTSVAATSEVKAAAPVSTEAVQVQAQPASTQPVNLNQQAPAVQPAPPVTAPAATKEASVSAPQAPAVPAAAAVQPGLTARNFILKQDDLNYGVTLVPKATRLNIPFKDNPAFYDGKDEIKTVIERMYPDVKNIGASVNAIAINVLSYKKDDKENDFGIVAIEFNEAAKPEFENYKVQMKKSMTNFFKDENFYMVDKFPMLVVIAHNLPDGKKDDIKWAYEFVQKKLEK